jgi:hypothetical protein
VTEIRITRIAKITGCQIGSPICAFFKRSMFMAEKALLGGKVPSSTDRAALQ